MNVELSAPNKLAAAISQSLPALFLIVLSLAQMTRAQAQNAAPQIQGDGPHNGVVIRAAGEKGRFVGFDLLIDDKVTIPVRFASDDAIFAPDATVGSRNGMQTLTFEGLRAMPDCGLELDASRIVISLPDHQFPVAAYDLHLKAFDSARWQETLGNNPFHFLALSLPDATLLHHRGLLTPTPKADRFPLLDDVPPGSIRKSAYPYNPQWSLRSPLCDQPLPVIGLWSPSRRIYAGWDFLAACLTSPMQPDLSTAYCNRLLLPSAKGQGRDYASASASRLDDREGRTKFVALVYPRGEHDYHQFYFPKGGEKFIGQATLVYSTDLGNTDDPNRLIWETWWNDPVLRRQMPAALPPVSFAWTGRIQGALPAPPEQSLLMSSDRGLALEGRGWLDENPLETAYQSSEKRRLPLLEGQASLLLRYSVRFKAEGEDCVYWRKPLNGSASDARDESGPSTLHHADGWAAGRLLLALYRHSPKKANLSALQGVFHWAKHCVWQRYAGEDTPGLPDLDGPALMASFLLDYYATFKGDAARHSDAVLSLELARTCAYRSLAMHPLDSPEGLRAFSWDSQGTGTVQSRTDTTRLACIVESLTQTAVMTGDPILLWVVQGSLAVTPESSPTSRGEGGETQTVSASTKESGPDALNLFLPVGDSALRVFAGEKAALAFARSESTTSVRIYRCTGAGDFAITFQSALPDFAATITFPYADLSSRPVWILRDGIIKIPLKPNERLFRNPDALWSLTVTGLHNRDVLIVGEPDLAQAENLPIGGLTSSNLRR